MIKDRKKILFVCTMNKWRSRTAETIFKDSAEYHVKSAGTSSSARIKVNQSLLDWADEVYVMEEKHRSIIKRKFEIDANKVQVLNIPDEYKYMDEDLVLEFTMLLN